MEPAVPPNAPPQPAVRSPEQAEKLVRRRLGSGRPWLAWTSLVATVLILALLYLTFAEHLKATVRISSLHGSVHWRLKTPPWHGDETAVDLDTAFLNPKPETRASLPSPLEPLTQLRRLEELSLRNAFGLPEADLAVLARLPRLRVLDLGADRDNGSDSPTVVGDDTLAWIAGLDRLNELDLSCSRVTDDGLRRLAGLKRLTRLDLRDTSITDASLPVLLSLPSLEALTLEGTRVTPAALDRLARARPILSIDHSALFTGSEP